MLKAEPELIQFETLRSRWQFNRLIRSKFHFFCYEQRTHARYHVVVEGRAQTVSLYILFCCWAAAVQATNPNARYKSSGIFRIFVTFSFYSRRRWSAARHHSTLIPINPIQLKKFTNRIIIIFIRAAIAAKCISLPHQRNSWCHQPVGCVDVGSEIQMRWPSLHSFTHSVHGAVSAQILSICKSIHSHAMPPLSVWYRLQVVHALRSVAFSLAVRQSSPSTKINLIKNMKFKLILLAISGATVRNDAPRIKWIQNANSHAFIWLNWCGLFIHSPSRTMDPNLVC